MEALRLEHARETYPYLQDDRMFSHFPELKPSSLERLQEIYERRIRGSPQSEIIWENWICRERSTARVIGDLQTTIATGDGLALIAYSVYVPFQRQGFAQEAVRVLLEHLREAHGISRVRAEIPAANLASIRLAESLGLHYVKRESDELIYECAL